MSSVADRQTDDYLESLELFGMRLGLERMHRVLAELNHPERRFPAIHIVGTNGKSSTARLTEALLADAGCRVGTYLSPHVTGWAERIRVDGAEADLAGLVGRVREASVGQEITQFEALTAAALLGFAESEVDVAVVEAGLGGRYDATNVLDSRIVVLTNVELEHCEHLGSSREAIAAEKLAVVREGCTVVLGQPEWDDLARASGAARIVKADGNLGCAAAAAGAFLGRRVDPTAAGDVSLPGRFEVRGSAPLEIWDGAHNPAAVRYLLDRLPERDFVLVASILDDKDVDEMLRLYARRCSWLVATSSSHPRALPAEELARRGVTLFTRVEAVLDPREALDSARAKAGGAGAVLVSGSLYLLVQLAVVRSGRLPWGKSATG